MWKYYLIVFWRHKMLYMMLDKGIGFKCNFHHRINDDLKSDGRTRKFVLMSTWWVLLGFSVSLSLSLSLCLSVSLSLSLSLSPLSLSLYCHSWKLIWLMSWNWWLMNDLWHLHDLWIWSYLMPTHTHTHTLCICLFIGHLSLFHQLCLNI